ncbi:MAG: glycosyltransferase [Vicinamibacterales bacterium]
MRRHRRPGRHVLHVVHKLGDGGADRTLTRLARTGLPGVRQTIYVLDGAGPGYGPLPPSVRVIAGPGLAAPLSGHVARIAGQVTGVDVVHGWVSSASLVAATYAAAIGAPLVLRQPTNIERERAETVGAHGRDTSPLGLAFRQAARVVLPSPALVDGTRRVYGVGDVTVIPNAAEGSPCQWHPHRAPGPFRVVFAGRLVAQKRPSLLVHALATLDASIDWRLQVFGDGPLSSEVEAAAAAAGVSHRVTLAGFSPAWIDAAVHGDVFALPTRYEGMCNTLVEAAAAGVPIVTTDIPENRYIFHPERDALLVPPDDVPALGAAVARLATDRALAARLGRAARGVVDRFPLAHMVLAYEHLYAAVA